MDDARPGRIVISTPLTAYAYGIAFCEWCQRPVYDQERYGRNRAMRLAARRRRLVLARRMHLVSGPDGVRAVSGACVTRLGIRAAREEEG